MKTIILLLSLILTNQASASKDCRMNLNTRGGAMSAMNDLYCDYSMDSSCKNRYARLVEILENKGYTITKDKDAPYKLHALGGSGNACGTGLKWYDYVMIPVSSAMTFEGNGQKIEKEAYKVGPAVGASHRAVARTLHLVEKFVPVCE